MGRKTSAKNTTNTGKKQASRRKKEVSLDRVSDALTGISAGTAGAMGTYLSAHGRFGPYSKAAYAASMALSVYGGLKLGDAIANEKYQSSYKKGKEAYDRM